MAARKPLITQLSEAALSKAKIRCVGCMLVEPHDTDVYVSLERNQPGAPLDVCLGVVYEVADDIVTKELRWPRALPWKSRPRCTLDDSLFYEPTPGTEYDADIFHTVISRQFQLRVELVTFEIPPNGPRVVLCVEGLKKPLVIEEPWNSGNRWLLQVLRRAMLLSE